MERDMDLARIILLTLAESDKPIDAGDPIFKGYPRSLVGYHFQILNEACLIVANVHGADNDPYYFATASRLTWEGNDFLDAIRDESIWKKYVQQLERRLQALLSMCSNQLLPHWR